MQIKSFELNPHPLKSEVEQLKIRLWEIQRALGGRPEASTISRMLNGHINMLPEVEDGIRQVIAKVKQSDVNAKSRRR